MTSMLGNGIYSFREAARLTGLRASRIREWFRGRPGETARKPVFHGDYAPVAGEFVVSFHDLIEVFVAGQLREHGVSLQTLRRVHQRMQKELDTKHPFCRRELLTDGSKVFAAIGEPNGEPEIMEVLTRQRVFPKILLPFLKRIDYDATTRLARKWHIGESIVIDPTICFGKPIVEPVGIKTEILAAAYQANRRDAELVADWFNIHPRYVLAAVGFESTIAA